MCKQNRIFLTALLLPALLVLGAALLAPAAAAQDDGQADQVVVLIETEGPLTPAMAGYVERGVRAASGLDAAALVFQLDTPGGELGLMQDIVGSLRTSATPVIVYVGPRGSAAWSAGTLIVLAGHVAAMAPETGIGAASPVGMGGELPETEERKAMEAVASLARELAQRRGAEVVAWAEAAVEEAAAASASEAYELGLIDYVAEDVEDLLQQVDGAEVEMRGERRVLHTAGARVERVAMTFIEQLLHIVVNPTIILTLLGIGVQALLIEIANPGGWVAGTIGIVSIALGVYGLGVLPVNGLGLVLIALALGLFVLEVKATTHGALTTAGVASLVAGALILFNTGDAPRYARISVPVVISLALSFAATSLFVMTKALRARRAPPTTGKEALVGSTAVARTALDPKGKVFVQGEWWAAEAEDGPIAQGEKVVITAVEGLNLHVRRSAPPAPPEV